VRKITLGARLSEEQHRTIAFLSDELGLSPSDVVRQILPNREQAEAIVRIARTAPLTRPGLAIAEIFGPALNRALDTSPGPDLRTFADRCG
jgi:hypothetical protein